MADVWLQRPNPSPKSMYKRPMMTPLPIALSCALALGSIAMVAFARYTGIGVLRMPVTAVVEYRDVAFRDLVKEGVEVIDPATGRIAERIALAEGGGFIQTVLSGMMVDRKRNGTMAESPYRVAKHSDGRLFLHDPATGRRQTLDAFGSVHTSVFQNLLARDMTRCSDSC